ncbi:MAG: hypothetical protein HND55_09475 [Pseudomonadota bacterium]|nr:MAG: hypothetical protein HND55_09475 [Pseudomonadota bacterium]
MAVHRPLPLRRMFGFAGAGIAAFFLAWAVVGLVPGIPSLLDVFGMPGIRVPAAITIGGLLTAAVGFHEF